jgi:hypothetical protein
LVVELAADVLQLTRSIRKSQPSDGAAMMAS